ncbi:MAG: hypothetical protein ACYSWR_03835 [Planctomycetota bacterium]
MTLAENQASARTEPSEEVWRARTDSHILAGPTQKILTDVASVVVVFFVVSLPKKLTKTFRLMV